MIQKIKENRIDTSQVWYGIPAEGILDVLGIGHGNLDAGINIVGIRQEILDNQPVIVFELSDDRVIPFAANGSEVASSDEIFKYFFDFKKLIEWTGEYFDRVIKNRKVIVNLKAALDSGRRIRSCERFQKQTELPIDEHFNLVAETYPRMPPERFFWIIGGKEKAKDIGTEHELKEYVTSDDKKILLSTPLMISEMPKYYFDPTSSNQIVHLPAVKINGIRIDDPDILHRLLKEKEIHSTFFQENFLSGYAFNAYITAIVNKLKRVIYSTFPDCFFAEDIRKSSLLDLYFQSWASDYDKSVMTFNHDSRKHSIEYFITEKMELEKDKIFKDGVNGSTWLSETTLESLIQEFSHSVKEDSY